MNYLEELFLDELADIYHAEKQLVKALPKMAKAANDEQLRSAFEEHLQQTENQVQRLEQVFRTMGKPAKAKPCKGMQGLIEEGQEILSEHKGTPALDAALISAAQKVEHYEIASYGCLCTWAELLDQSEALDLLKETMNEEEETDKRLTEIAESSINLEATESDEEGETAGMRRAGRSRKLTGRRG
jgi:ferritin-like metal-binding protein YciE